MQKRNNNNIDNGDGGESGDDGDNNKEPSIIHTLFTLVNRCPMACEMILKIPVVHYCATAPMLYCLCCRRYVLKFSTTDSLMWFLAAT